MKALYYPSGGKFGYGYNFGCSYCGNYLGNSYENKKLVHDTYTTKWFKKFRIDCPFVGLTFEMPKFEIELKEDSK